MKLIEPKFEIIEQQESNNELINCMYKHIEKCGRTCYKSDDKITESSAWPFVGRMIASEHYAMLEHGTVYLTIVSDPHCQDYIEFDKLVRDMKDKYSANKYSKVNTVTDYKKMTFTVYITTNFRVIIENNWVNDLKYMTACTDNHERRVTVRFTCDIGVSREFNRHRVDSIAEQSTRYCNFAKTKFDSGVTYSYLPWCSTDDAVEPEHSVLEYDTILPYNTTAWNPIDWWLWSISASETAYLKMVEGGWLPEQARVVLPLNTVTELVHTAFVSDWVHFFKLRALGLTGKPHPQAKELAFPLMAEFEKHNYI